MLCDAHAREYASRFVAGWAEESRQDMVGISEMFDTDQEDTEKIMSWVDKASVLVVFEEGGRDVPEGVD